MAPAVLLPNQIAEGSEKGRPAVSIADNRKKRVLKYDLGPFWRVRIPPALRCEPRRQCAPRGRVAGRDRSNAQPFAPSLPDGARLRCHLFADPKDGYRKFVRRSWCDLEPFQGIRSHFDRFPVCRGQARFEGRCGVSVEKRNAATARRKPAFGGPDQPADRVLPLARYLASRCATRLVGRTDLAHQSDSQFPETALGARVLSSFRPIGSQ